MLSVFIILITSCTREFERDISFNKQVVVNSVLIAGSPVIIGLHFSIPVNDSTGVFDPQFISNAYVEISDSHGNRYILDTTSNYEIYPPLNGVIQNNYYRTVYYTEQLIPKEGETYYLKVYVPGFDTIYSKTTVPFSPDTGKFLYNITYTPELREVEIELELKNYGDNNYYWLEAASGFSYPTCTDPAATATYNGFLINGDLFPERSYTIFFKASVDTMIEDTAMFYLFRANKEFYYYFISYMEQYPPEIPNPYQEPVVVYSNIKNGLGIFTSFSKPIFLKVPLKNLSR